MIGEYDYDIITRCHRILIVDERGEPNRTAVTFSFIQHKVADIPDGERLPITEILKGEGSEKVLRAFANALQQMGLFPDNHLAGEMKATKFHLEDMRKLYLREIAR